MFRHFNSDLLPKLYRGDFRGDFVSVLNLVQYLLSYFQVLHFLFRIPDFLFLVLVIPNQRVDQALPKANFVGNI